MTVKILSLGDSLTWGVSDNNVTSGDQSGGYRTFLQDSLGASGFQNPTDIDFVGEQDNLDGRVSGPNSIDPDHQGQRGDRIEEIHADLTANSNALLNTLSPDIVLLMAGTNNLLQNETAAAALDQLEILIETLANTAAQHILVASIPPFDITGTSGNLGANDEAHRISFNNQLPTFLQDTNRFNAATIAKLKFVDVAGGLETADVSSDGVHLLSTGYSKVATVWHNALVPVLDSSISLATIERGTPQRLEAESFSNLGGFNSVSQSGDGLPDNTQVIRLNDASGSGTATTAFTEATGYYDVTIGYFDENDAEGAIDVTIGDDTLERVNLDRDLGAANVSPENYTHTTIGQRIQLTNGDQISLTGTPGIGGNNELVSVDYLEFIPVPAPASTPDPTPNPTPDPTPSPGPTPGPSPSPNPSPSPGPSPSPSPGPNPSPSPDPAIKPTPAPGIETVGSGENDTFLGTANNDVFRGKGGNDRAEGEEGDDLLIGGTGNDRLFGEDGTDRIRGGRGRDRIFGGPGDDELIGGRDIDTLQGNEGADMFVYTNRKDGGNRGDRIRDFDGLEDTLVFRGRAFDDSFKRDRTLRKRHFTIGSQAKRRSHRFIYNDQSGLLSFDPDGKGEQEAFKLARLDAGLDLDQRSIFIT